MIEFLTELDTQLLLTINALNTPALDQFMYLLSAKLVWLPLYIILLLISVHRYGWGGGMFIAFGIALAVLIADQTCSSLIRPLVERMRPSNPNNPISTMVHIVNDYRGGRYGFPSCHAANTVAVATFLSLVYKGRKVIITSLILWAIMNCYSRMYLGVHYPGDILVGSLIGYATGYCIYNLTLSAIFWWIEKKEKPTGDIVLHIAGSWGFIPEIKLTNSVLLGTTVAITSSVLLLISLISYY